MDHEVEDHVDVGAALGERRQAMALDEARLGDDLGGGADRRIEALEVPDLQDAPARVGELDQRPSLGDRRGERLLDQHVDSRPQELGGHDGVRLGRHRDARAVDAADERAQVRQHRHAERGGDLAGAGARRGRPRRPASRPRRAAYFSAWKRPR